MRILFLTQWFDPEPTFKGLIFARELVRRGHQVEVLTGFPNYPGGKVYPGYRIRWRQVEDHGGVRVVRVPLYPSHDASAIGRIANYASFALSAAVLGAFLVSRPDVIYVYHPPVTVGLPAAVLRLIFRCPIVYDVQDLWPESVEASGMVPRRLTRPLAAACRWVYRHADRVVTLSPGMMERLLRHGVRPERLSCIYNWCDETTLTGDAGSELLEASRRPGEFVVLYAGAMGTVQGLQSVLDAAGIVAAAARTIRFIFVGSGIAAERLQRIAADRSLSNVTFLQRQPLSNMPGMLGSADALLVHLKDLPLFQVTIPSKTQAYMAMGRPIVMGVRGDAADLVARAGCGVTCEPENAQSIADTVVALQDLPHADRDAMGEKGKTFYREELSLARGVQRFEVLFAEAGRKPC